MAHNVAYILKEVEKHKYTPKFLFEITAGQGSELGYLIEDLAKFYQ
ncbi:hypothetical protein KBC03_05040 [Patescibacteria group bacterium]|nr:hypothetical protein [Patescibacteria group bacterium]